mgnify:CR=1 FL=1
MSTQTFAARRHPLASCSVALVLVPRLHLKMQPLLCTTYGALLVADGNSSSLGWVRTGKLYAIDLALDYADSLGRWPRLPKLFPRWKAPGSNGTSWLRSTDNSAGLLPHGGLHTVMASVLSVGLVLLGTVASCRAIHNRLRAEKSATVSYTHLTLPPTPYV